MYSENRQQFDGNAADCSVNRLNPKFVYKFLDVKAFLFGNVHGWWDYMMALRADHLQLKESFHPAFAMNSWKQQVWWQKLKMIESKAVWYDLPIIKVTSELIMPWKEQNVLGKVTINGENN